MGTELFQDLSNFGSLEFLIGNSPDELLEQLRSIRRESKLVSIYAYGNGTRHIAWFFTQATIKKVPKTKEKKS